jgi:uncharacterized phage protein (TIGR01671 family)
MGTLPSPPDPLPLNPGADRGGTDSDMDCIKGGKKMRGLSFRAWDKVAGRFLHPWPDGFAILGETTCFDLIGMQLKERSPEKSTLEMLNDVVIMQFTGILDKNGKEIYEGDVIRAVSPWNRVQKVIMVGQVSYNFYGFWELEKIKATVWKGFSEGVRPHDSVPISSLSVSYGLEVIGNIYENPELVTP